MLGLVDFKRRLNKNTPDLHREQAAADAATLAMVETLPESAFAGDDWLDRRAFLSELRAARLFATTLPRWRDNPQVDCHAAGCEEMFVSEGLVQLPAVRLMQLHDALWRACRIVIDYGLQSGELTPAGAVRYLSRTWTSRLHGRVQT